MKKIIIIIILGCLPFVTDAQVRTASERFFIGACQPYPYLIERPTIIDLRTQGGCIPEFVCAMAQEQDPWVGTWTSEPFRAVNSHAYESKKGVIYSNYKYIIRITKSNNEYFVRKKMVNLEDSDDVYYSSEITITSIKGNTMWIESSHTYTYSDKADIIERKITNQKKLELRQGGVMKYSYYNNHNRERNIRSGIVTEYDEAIDLSSKIYCLNLFNDNC